MKRCRTCGEYSPLDDFYVRANSKDGRQNECKLCLCARTRRNRKNWKPRTTRQNFKRAMRRFGLTLTDWHEMLIAQAGRCAICLEPMTRPNVDHDHSTGRIRGLLCDTCNPGLGFFHDDPAKLRAAAAYVAA